MNSKTIGILAHVDAGKTTLIEAILYMSGVIKKLGRVDHKDAFLDTEELEKARGITIFSKQAFFEIEDVRYYLLDTPGHVDFSTEMERSISVMDYAILVVNAVDLVQSHTVTVWKMLKKYNVPTFIFVNKMDRCDIKVNNITEKLKQDLNDRCVNFLDKENLIENVASVDEELLEKFFEESLSNDEWKVIIKDKIKNREIFPCFFGSALQNEGVTEFINSMNELIKDKSYSKMNNDSKIKRHKGIVFKILHDKQKNRITFIKVLDKKFVVKDIIGEEKINQIRLYNGEKYTTTNEVNEGEICAVTGLSVANIGDIIIDGEIKKSNIQPMIVPVLTSKVIINDGTDEKFVLDALHLLEIEDPMLQVKWNEVLKEINISIMGKIQLEILKDILDKRFGFDVDFDKCEIVYKETIDKSVMCVGHFEPLRHYSEAHIRLEPAKVGSGIHISSECKFDILDKNHQNTIMHSLNVKKHKGILTGFELTDVNMILVKGKSHLKHTEGGDFYEASTRAIRHGLEKLGREHNILLEPFYSFEIIVPMDCVGRVMSDVQKMYGTFEPPIIENDTAIVKGTGPVATFMDYPLEITSYTKGHGKVAFNFLGYRKCHNQDEVIEKIAYNKDNDLENPSYSVFCSHGAGFNVMWEDVEEYAHLEVENV